jgi:hypothetical protein
MATVIFVLLVADLTLLTLLILTRKKGVRTTELLFEQIHLLRESLEVEQTRNTQLEAEIQRLRKIPLTQSPEKVDNSTIKAKSSADVRRLTEAAFGLQPEIGVSNENE